jgi:hypothetical protein
MAPDDGLVDDREEPEEPVGVALGSFTGCSPCRGKRHVTGRLLKVDAGTEGWVGAGQDDGIDVRVVAGRGDRVPQRVHQLQAERVASVGAVEGHRRDAIVDVDEDDRRWLGHVASRCRA